jgi:SulP family sulfate permease
LQAVRHFPETHLPSLLVGLIGVFLLLVLKYWMKRLPGALVVVVLGTLVSWLLALDQGGIKIVDTVPDDLPALFIPSFDGATLKALWPPAITVAFISFIEGIAIAKVHATKHGYELDANRELIGLGAATLVGAFFRGYPTTGSFARTAVNVASGARTGLSSVISAGVIALTLLFLTPLFYYLPNTVLAAIVIVAVLGLIDLKGAAFLWQVDRQDFFLMLLTFITTLALGIEEGIIVGVLASLFTFIYRSSRPHTAEMGQLPGTRTFRNLERNPDALVRSDVRIFRMDASLYFANVAYFKERLYEVSDENGAPRAIVIDLYPVNRIDSTGVEALQEAIAHLRQEGCEIYLASVKGPVHDKLEAAGILEFIGTERIYHEVHEAVSAAERAPPAPPVPNPGPNGTADRARKPTSSTL